MKPTSFTALAFLFILHEMTTIGESVGNPDEKYLYRGLRQEEIDAGFILIPKGVDVFEHPTLLSLTSGV